MPNETGKAGKLNLDTFSHLDEIATEVSRREMVHPTGVIHS